MATTIEVCLGGPQAKGKRHAKAVPAVAAEA